MDAVESPKFGKEFPVKIARALISMMARSSNALQAEAGYIDARPQSARLTKPLATRGRTIHSGQSRRFCSVRRMSGSGVISEILIVRFLPVESIGLDVVQAPELGCRDTI